MRRRDFITLLGGAAAWPLAAHGQQPERMRRIAVIFPVDDQLMHARHAAFIQGLHQLGWTEGWNVHIDVRWSSSNAAEIRRHVAELVALAPDVFFAPGIAALERVLETTRTVPIVFVIIPDPVGSGVVKSLSRPGGNATGFMMLEYNLCAKWLELVKEIAPNVTRVAVLRDSGVTAGIGQFAVIQSVAGPLGVEVIPVNLNDAAEFERELVTFAESTNGGLILTASALSAVHRDPIITLASRHKLPAVYQERNYAAAGGLISYGPNFLDSSGELRDTSIASSRATSQPTCRYRRRPNTIWWSILRPPERSASMCRHRCSRAPTR